METFIVNKDKYYKTNINGFNENNLKNFWLCIARGCQYNCTYCGGSKYAHKKYYGRNEFCFRSFPKVKDDIDYLIRQGVEIISLTHDIEMLPYTDMLLKYFIDRNVGLYYESFNIPGKQCIEKLYDFAKDKVTVAITAVSGNEEIRIQEGKHFQNEQLISVVNALSSRSIKCDIYFTLNNQNESITMFQKTVELACELLNYPGVNVFCIPYFQNEIGSIRWDLLKENKASAIHILNEYLTYTNKNAYFIKKDKSLYIKMLYWNLKIGNK